MVVSFGVESFFSIHCILSRRRGLGVQKESCFCISLNALLNSFNDTEVLCILFTKLIMILIIFSDFSSFTIFSDVNGQNSCSSFHWIP
jgi:hypothetical protein